MSAEYRTDSVLIDPQTFNIPSFGRAMPWLSSVVIDWDYSASYEGVSDYGGGNMITQILTATSSGSQTLTGDTTRQIVQVGQNFSGDSTTEQMNEGLAAGDFRSYENGDSRGFAKTSATKELWEWQDTFGGVLNGQSFLTDGTDEDPLCIVTNGKANITDCALSQTTDGILLDIQIWFNGVGFADPAYEGSLFTNKVIIQEEKIVAPADLYFDPITITVDGVTGLEDDTITTDTTTTTITLTLTKAIL